MQTYLIVFLVAAFVWRIATVVVSTRHEAALKSSGAKEYGGSVSLLLAGFHLMFYVSTVIESSLRDHIASFPSLAGIVLYIFSALALVSVIRSLGPLWTIKLIIAPQHRIVRTGLFSFVRHPNYFVSIVPELVGLGLATNAYWTLCVGLPLYAIPLGLRIKQEEGVMKRSVPGYAQSLQASER